MKNLYSILESKLESNDLICIIYSFISEKKPIEIQEVIEKLVYNIYIYKSWNLWWKNRKILNKKERSDYNISTYEENIKKNIIEIERSFFIYNR